MTSPPPPPPPNKRPTGLSGQPGPPGPPGPPPSFNSLAKAIVQEQKEQKSALAEAIDKPSSRKKWGPIALAALVIANVVGWIIIPPVSDGRGDRRTPVEIERDLRLVVASAASEVEVWRRLHDNAMPKALPEAGVRDTGLVLVPIDSAVYEIRGKDREIFVTYRSNMTVTDFLDAAPVLRR